MEEIIKSCYFCEYYDNMLDSSDMDDEKYYDYCQYKKCEISPEEEKDCEYMKV